MEGTTRRSFLAAGLAAPLAAATIPSPATVRPPRRAGRLLVLGGTRFLGPPIVRRALDAGWEVTLANRGKSNPGLFGDLDHREIDRDKGDLDALAEGKWDAVVDTSGYAPLHVQKVCELLRDRTSRFVFVSTVSVYPDQSAALVGEDTKTGEPTAEAIAAATTIQQAQRDYGAMKAECERAAERAMPGRVTVVRPGLIVGPEDSSDRFTWWPYRIAQGGEVLAPGDGTTETQFVDVRDLGAFCFDVAHAEGVGVHNAVGFRGRVSLGEVLAGCKITLNTDCTLTWVDEDFLREQKVRAYTQMPLWLPKGQRGRFDNRKAIAAGLTFRSIAETIRDTFEWQRTRPADYRWRGGLGLDRERELLALWRQRGTGR